MCAVSMITDHYRDKWNPLDNNSMVWISRSQYNEYLELKRKMEEYDRRTNQPDCVKPEVADWEKKIEEVLKKRGIL